MYLIIHFFILYLIGLSLNEPNTIVSFCQQNNVSLVVVGPEDPLAYGIVDEISPYVPCFGPTKAAARLESSKSFAKSFMKKAKIPTAMFKSFCDIPSALSYINSQDWLGTVVKASGLAGGKGVYVANTKEEASDAARKMLAGKFGNASREIVIEEKLEGEEVSALFFTDGTTISAMPLVQDYKRLSDGDEGPNTGGMGVVGPITHYGTAVIQQIESICRRTIKAMSDVGSVYKGVLYLGLMIKDDRVNVLEYNCRFGDPETEILMRLLDSDLYDILMSCCNGTLAETSIKWRNDYAFGLVLVADGYPLAYDKGDIISGIPDADDRCVVFQAGTKQLKNGDVVTHGGRVLCVTSLGKSIEAARSVAYIMADEIYFKGKKYRKDIGLRFCNGRSLTYCDSGVDISEGNRLVEQIKSICDATKIPATDQIGGFGAVCDLAAADLGDSQLVIGMDGVGTKLAIADELNCYDDLGDDLVGMCANDVLCHCAQPVAFLDYYVTGKLCSEKAYSVISSIAKACKSVGCALVGGETAEMPGVYGEHQWDIAGVCVAARRKNWPLLPQKASVVSGDVLIGLRSSGLHSNGFSMIRKIFQANKISYNTKCPWCEISFGTLLLRGTRLYVKSCLPLFADGYVKGAAHITGGGLKENVGRVLPSNLKAVIDTTTWVIPELFDWIQSVGPVEPPEMMRTFNCGIGMVIVASKEQSDTILEKLKMAGEDASVIGHVQPRINGEDQVKFIGLQSAFSGKYRQPPRKRVKVGILISGKGSNMEKLINSSRLPDSDCEIVLVISNKNDAPGIALAKRKGVRTAVIPSKGYLAREVYEEKMNKELEANEVQLICLAGFMRILSPSFVEKWNRRVINIHPSLLPSFKGAHAVRDALAARVKITGCTVHFASEEVDNGEIIAQAAVPILDDDDIEMLHRRIQDQEHLLFPKAMQMVARTLL
ncbi:hypothetical protein AB6A40_006588 [Gnathostoma spinigerum]|uniref:Trifunctional purine biosynthetic protein adenosine-3 n=1 Tax=Gnathostoma spinigerum TaxID=75299 RepID=A0ABD6ERG9_9BILA